MVGARPRRLGAAGGVEPVYPAAVQDRLGVIAEHGGDAALDPQPVVIAAPLDHQGYRSASDRGDVLDVDPLGGEAVGPLAGAGAEKRHGTRALQDLEAPPGRVDHVAVPAGGGCARYCHAVTLAQRH